MKTSLGVIFGEYVMAEENAKIIEFEIEFENDNLVAKLTFESNQGVSCKTYKPKDLEQIMILTESINSKNIKGSCVKVITEGQKIKNFGHWMSDDWFRVPAN